MNPCHFGPASAPLFGMYHAPRASVARNAAVLMCAPIGFEYMRTHYAMRTVAKQIASAGIHVLRFDYHGTGDSAGDIGPGEYAVWTKDIALAAQELSDISGVGEPTVVGLRLGATLAIEALARAGMRARGAVLWDPVVDGAEYVEALEGMHRRMAALRVAPPTMSDELLGTRYPEDLRAAIRQMDLTKKAPTANVGSVALVTSEERPEYASLLAALRTRWPNATSRVVADSAAWHGPDASGNGRIAGPIVRAIADAAESLA